MPPKTMVGLRAGAISSMIHDRPTSHFDDSLGFSEQTDMDTQAQIPKGFIPPNQIKNLSEKQLDTSFTRTITAMDPNVKKTAVKYHYRDGMFRMQARNDHLAVHFSMDGNLVHISSPEGRALSQGGSKDAMRSGADDPELQLRSSATAQVGDPDMSTDFIGEGVIIGGDALISPAVKPVKNQFNFTERACMTFKPPVRNKSLATAPPPRRDGSGSITQWIIFDTYLKEYNAQLAARDLRDSRKPGKDDVAEGKDDASGQTHGSHGSGESGSGAGANATGAGADNHANGAASGASSGSAHAQSGSSSPSTSAVKFADAFEDASPKQPLMLEATEPQRNPDEILSLPSLSNALKVMERAVNQTSSIDAFRDFKFDEISAMLAVQESLVKNADATANPQVPAIAPEGKGVAGNCLAPGRDGFRHLWTYGHDASQATERAARSNKATFGTTTTASTLTTQSSYEDSAPVSSKAPLKKTVTAIAWNPAYADLFAVGLGSYDYLKQSGGYVCCYSLKNVSYPEAKFKTASGVMCLDWHPNLPSLLVVGMHDGTICVYDVRSKTNSEPIFSTTNPATRHTGPVWQVAWDEDPTVLSFSSLSSDGRYVRWVVNKNDLDQDEVLTIALRSNDSELSKIYDSDSMDEKFDPALVTAASGTCFDINPTLNLLVVGTEEGNVSTYDISHNSKFSFAFQGHNMSVYSVKWSPFHPTVFLSCSADWTVKMWEYSTRNPIMTFDMHGPVGDVAWAPYKSTVFGCVTQEGFVKVFDLALDKAAPICGDYRPVANTNVRLTHLAFNSKEPVLAVTDQHGGVHVLKLTGRLYKLNALKLEDIDPVLEQDILQKLLIIQDEKGNNKITKTFRTAWAQRKTEERIAAEKKAAEANLAKKSSTTDGDD